MEKNDSYEHYAGPTDTDTKPETAPLAPRIYVASLSDYNAGRLHGGWLDPTRDFEDVQADVHAMLTASPEPGAEEVAIHDYEGFGGWRVDEYERLETVAAVARGIAEHGQVYGALAGLIGAETLVEEPERFRQSWLGSWASLDDFVTEMARDMGWEEELEQLPPSLQPYVQIDYGQLARDVQLELTVIEQPDGVAVFDPRLW
jgi:antirestriction protein